MNIKKNVLWPLGNKCPYNCKYCYLKFDEQSNPVSCAEVSNDLDILKHLNYEQIDKVFLAGAEPLMNKNVFKIIKSLVDKNIKTILCTNGVLLDKNRNIDKIVKSGLAAVSISLDSATPEYTDYYRNEKSWLAIVNATKKLKEELLKNNSITKVGIYMVVSHKNIGDMFAVCELCKKLNLDYFIYQPITLPKNHSLYKELALNNKDIETLKKQSQEIKTKQNIYVPNEEYDALMIKSLISNKIKACFITNNFVFLLQDGSLSPCPVFKMVVDKKNIYKDKDYSFNCIKDCKCFSEECSNIFQLLCFDEVLNYDKK